eukprot:12424541-Karenia_brevis.AAC.1
MLAEGPRKCIGKDVENVYGWIWKMYSDGLRKCIRMDFGNVFGWILFLVFRWTILTYLDG